LIGRKSVGEVLSVMPGCYALDRIMLYPPRLMADYVLFILGKGQDMIAEPVLR
jgi:hypothetical protein